MVKGPGTFVRMVNQALTRDSSYRKVGTDAIKVIEADEGSYRSEESDLEEKRMSV